MPKVKVNKVAAYELEGKVFANMADVEIAVRKAVINDVLDRELSTHYTLDECAEVVARAWVEIKNNCDAAFAGI